MSKKPRTPVHYPQMRVRGRRNRAKLAARRATVAVIPMMRLCQSSPHEIGLVAVTTWEPGTYRLEHKTVRDGYGRVIGTPKATATPVPDPNPAQPSHRLDAVLMSIIAFRGLQSTEGAPPDAP